MSDITGFDTNHEDLSTENGFQFEFRCKRCGSGFRTKFKPWGVASASNVIDAIGDVFGGVLGKVGDFGENMESAGWEKAHGKAFEKAVKEIKPEFIQCPGCREWVCRDACLDSDSGLCKECAPGSFEEDVDVVIQEDETIEITCLKCEAVLNFNAKFCPECGGKLHQIPKCKQCNATINPDDKFCRECGTKV
jgi:ribosomal protein L40E